MSNAAFAVSKSEYAGIHSHEKTYIDGYYQGQADTIDRVKAWLVRNKTGIMGVHDIYIDLYLHELDNMKND